MTTATAKKLFTNYDYAQMYASLGIRVYPLRPVVKGDDGVIRCSCSATCAHPGKHPLILDYVNEASTKPGKLFTWFKEDPSVGIGMALHGYLAIDFDVRKSYEEAEEWQRLYADELPPTVLSWSGRGDGGMHMLYRLPEGATITKAKQNAVLHGKLTEAIEFKVNAGALVLPPSMHAAGNFYRWESGWSPTEREIATAPWWLVSLVQAAMDFNKPQNREKGGASRSSQDTFADQAERVANAVEVPNDDFFDAEALAHHIAAYTEGTVNKAGDGYQTNCPVHGDEKPSLTVGTGSEGQTLVHCHAENPN